VQPAELATRLGAGEKPLLVHVGFKKLYQQAHIPGSEFFGPGSDPQVLAKLRERLAELPRTSEVIIYCGCCPLEHCPNVEPAYAAVRELGFSNATVLYIPKDLGADWVAHGYPVAKGN
jgi:thiosulfate/3-mercaptopyruvate sulfurtransferase